MHYTAWPEYGVPDKTESLINLVQCVRQLINGSMARKQRKLTILVHCSAGVGRTGTFLALYQLMEELDGLVPKYLKGERRGPDMTLDIFNTVFKLRSKRMYMVGPVRREKSHIKDIYPRIIRFV